jgi:excisionase family DNA binding protein
MDDAARSLGVSRSSIERLITDENMPTIKLGGRRMIPVQPLKDWIAKKLEVMDK